MYYKNLHLHDEESGGSCLRARVKHWQTRNILDLGNLVGHVQDTFLKKEDKIA